MKKLEMIIKPEKLDDVKKILDDSKANGVMVTNIMGYGAQKGFKRIYRGNEYFVNLLPKVKVETVVAEGQKVGRDVLYQWRKDYD